MKVLIPGGHITPAIRLITELSKHQDKAVLVSAKYTSKYAKVKAIEPIIAKQYSVPHFTITSCKWNKFNKLSIFKAIPMCFASIFQSLRIINSVKPDVIVSFGGYLSIPVCISGWLRRIPIIIHEQTTQAGLANRFIAIIAQTVAITHITSKSYFPPKKTVLTGNLLRKEFYNSNPIKSLTLKLPNNKPILYVTGGNQGSIAINSVIFDSLPELVGKFTIIHQVGRARKFNHRQLAFTAQSKLPSKHQSSYIFKPWFEVEEVVWILNNARITLSRAGANTISEIIQSEAVGILVPLPISSQNEQLKNAQILEKASAGIIIPQDLLTKEFLISNLIEIDNNYSQLKKNIRRLKSKVPQQSAQHFYKLIKNVIKD